MEVAFSVTPDAAVHIEKILETEPQGSRFRISVQGGGCSGFQYGFTFDEIANEDDFDIEVSGVKFLVDSMSAQYLQGANIDYVEDIHGSSFTIKNPNAQTTCGCGSSFSV